MKNSSGEVLEDNWNNDPVSYLHGSTAILPMLQVQLEGLKTGDKKLVYLTSAPGLSNEDFLINSKVTDKLKVNAMFSYGIWEYKGNATVNAYFQADNTPVPGYTATTVYMDKVKVGDAAQMTASLGASYEVLTRVTLDANYNFNDSEITINNSFQYGPICIDIPYRGKGIINLLVEFMRENMVKRYPIAVTFINKINIPSFKAHTQKLNWTVIADFEFNSNAYYVLAMEM